MIRSLCIVALLAVPLAACDNAKDGTDITINAAGENGSVLANVDGETGRVAIAVPGFSGKLKLPKIRLDADDFDMNGVHLYPGSTISGINIDAKDGPRDGQDDGTVHLSFASPAEPATVRDWFEGKLTAAGFTLSRNGGGLSGKTDDGKPFRLELAPAGVGKASGSIVIG